MLFVQYLLLASLKVAVQAAGAAESTPELRAFLAGDFRWHSTPAILSAIVRPDDPCVSVKDPTVVRDDGRWHLFSTIRSAKRTHQIEYLNFTDWSAAASAPRHILTVSTGYFCAPQVFRYTPHNKWYLIYQGSDPSRKPSLQPVYSTSTNLADPGSWTAPRLLFASQPTNVTGWIDFWVICDAAKAHLFFTSNDGRMWRSETPRAEFPGGWSGPTVVLKDDIFEASHTYRLSGLGQYLTLVEAQGEGGRRYYKAYLADRLEGNWRPLAGTAAKPFASHANVAFDSGRWTDSISHGELLRSGSDEYLDVDPAHLRFLYQGVSDLNRQGKPYGRIPWELGLLEPISLTARPVPAGGTPSDRPPRR